MFVDPASLAPLQEMIFIHCSTEVCHPTSGSCEQSCGRTMMLFPEAWGRSQCRSLERMVEVEQEYPGGVEHIYSPGCVPLLRCSGCCNDDKLSCFPVSTRNISIQA
ncbi:hypothetical protein cypCar_00041845 [Cyprinus carpio]|nr:hypothetical protein cypCar_00041845 [Cyprinus carpio]